MKPQPTPLKAIRSWCIECSGGDRAEARRCIKRDCVLWPYRLGMSPSNLTPGSQGHQRQAEADKAAGEAVASQYRP